MGNIQHLRNPEILVTQTKLNHLNSTPSLHQPLITISIWCAASFKWTFVNNVDGVESNFSLSTTDLVSDDEEGRGGMHNPLNLFKFLRHVDF